LDISKVKNILTALCLLTFLISMAQDDYVRYRKNVIPQADTSRFSIGFFIGPVFAGQAFSGTGISKTFWDFNSPDSINLQGFAKTGLHIDIVAAFRITQFLGIMINYGYSSNPFNSTAFSTAEGADFTSSPASFHTSEYMIGPYLTISESEKVTLEANFMIGLVKTTYPSLTTSLVDTSYTFAINSGRSFGYSFGAALKYRLNSVIDISLGISCTQTKMSFPGWTFTESSPGYYPYVVNSPTDVTQMTMRIISPTAGIVFKL
jgi:hypothetical protein